MKKLIFSVLAVAAMASCSKSELTERPEEAAIKVKSEVLTVKQTKTPFEGITSTTSLTARVIASTVSGNFDPADATALWHDADIVFADGSNTTPVGYNPSKSYPTNDDYVYLCGLYPNSTTDWTNFSVATSGGSQSTTAAYVFDGKTDVMIAGQVATKKSEVLATTPSYKTLTFNHMLTKLVVRAKAKTTGAITDFGDITEIVLVKAGGNDPANKMVATINAGTADPSSVGVFTAVTAGAEFPFYTVASGAATDTAFTGQTVALVYVDGTTVTEAPSIAYSLVAPVVADGTEDYELLVKTSENTDGFPVKVNLKDAGGATFTGSTQGKAFVITLEFESTPIEALGTVTPWDEVVIPDDITIK